MIEDYKSRTDWILAFFIPLGFLALTFVLEQFMGLGCFTACEDGPVENIQAIVVFVAFGIGVSLVRHPADYPRWVWGWLMLGTLGCLYIGLEEISYGQRLFGWVTPESWDLVNDQQETNLHNTSSWLDQKPRALLEIGVYVGGLLIPILRKAKPSCLPQKWSAIYPANMLFLTALIALLVRLYDSGTEAMGRQDLFLIDRGSELQESYFDWFILLYMIDMRRRFRPASV